MLFNKRITSEVIECKIIRDYTLPRAYSQSVCTYENNCEFCHDEESEGISDYYVEYQLLAVKFQLFGKDRIEKFYNITLHSKYKVHDSITIIYDRFTKKLYVNG